MVNSTVAAVPQAGVVEPRWRCLIKGGMDRADELAVTSTQPVDRGAVDRLCRELSLQAGRASDGRS